MQWERADPPWELPNYIGEFAQALKENQAWIASGGVAAPVTAVPLWILPPTDPTLPAPRNGESEVSASDEELLIQKHLFPKVRLSDKVEHMLDKDAWATTLATHIGWKIFVDVSQDLAYLGQ